MSEINFRYVNLDRSEALEQYTYEHMQNLLRRLDGRHGGAKDIEVRFSLENRGTQGQIKDCEVMISYRYPGLSEAIHVKKHGTDIKLVLIEAIHATEVVIHKATEKFEGGRHHIGKSKKSVRDFKRAESTEEESASTEEPS